MPISSPPTLGQANVLASKSTARALAWKWTTTCCVWVQSHARANAWASIQTNAKITWACQRLAGQPSASIQTSPNSLSSAVVTLGDELEIMISSTYTRRKIMTLFMLKYNREVYAFEGLKPRCCSLWLNREYHALHHNTDWGMTCNRVGKEKCTSTTGKSLIRPLPPPPPAMSMSGIETPGSL